MKKTIIALTSAALIAALPLTSPATGIPVIDLSNLVQNTTTALKQVAAYAQQVQQYQTQILQYKNQILNTTGIAPALQVWQQAQQTINSVMGVTKIFQTGSQLQTTLGQFQNVNYWLAAPPGSFTYQTQGSVNQTTANASMINGIVAQQAQIQKDAQQLQTLQSQAKTTTGQKQALDAANQLAGLEQNSLLQIRALLIQEQQALAARNTTTANDDAMHQAATQTYYGTILGPQPHTGW